MDLRKGGGLHGKGNREKESDGKNFRREEENRSSQIQKIPNCLNRKGFRSQNFQICHSQKEAPDPKAASERTGEEAAVPKENHR